MNGMDRRFVSCVPALFIGSSGGGIAQVVHHSAVEKVVTLTRGVTVAERLKVVIISLKNVRVRCCSRSALKIFCVHNSFRRMYSNELSIRRGLVH